MKKNQPDQTYIPYKSSISNIIYNALPPFFVKIANSLLLCIQMFSFILITTLKRILRRKVLNIFAIFIVFISIFSLNVNCPHFLNNICNDESLICDTGHDSIDDVSNLSICNVYQIPSNDLIIFIAPSINIFFNPHVLAYKNSTRAPPA